MEFVARSKASSLGMVAFPAHTLSWITDPEGSQLPCHQAPRRSLHGEKVGLLPTAFLEMGSPALVKVSDHCSQGQILTATALKTLSKNHQLLSSLPTETEIISVYYFKALTL